jgi:YD repeat-containing protein
MSFTGMPNKSVISYAMDLSSVVSGIYPYYAGYDVYLTQMTMGTIKTWTKKRFGRTRMTQESFFETRQLEKAFPTEMTGSIVTRNQTSSPYGTGWDIGGVQKIINPQNARIVITESGSVSHYQLNNNIETVLHAPFALHGADLSNFPTLYVVSAENTTFKIDTSIDESSLTQIGTAPDYTGVFHFLYVTSPPSILGNWDICTRHYFPYSIKRDIRQILTTNNGALLYLDQKGQILKNDSSILAGAPELPPSFWGRFHNEFYNTYQRRGTFEILKALCNNDIDLTCGEISRDAAYPGKENIINDRSVVDFNPYELGTSSFSHAWPRDYCESNFQRPGAGQWPSPGSSNGGPSVSKLNMPSSMLAGNDGNILIADHGNHKIRTLDLNTYILSDFAGTGNNYDGDNGNLAINTAIKHPRGLAYDSHGNLYFSGGGGYVRKIDPNGYVSHVAGNPSGALVDSGHASEMRLNQPFGLAIDNDNNYLYVADTGHNRVVQINLGTMMANTVAGNSSSTCSPVLGDGGPALSATLCGPELLGLDDNNNLLIFDKGNNRIRRVRFDHVTDGTIKYSPVSKDLSTLERNADGTFERIYRNGNKVYYDASGRQSSTVSRSGTTTSYEYNGGGQLSKVIDPAGGFITYGYDGNGYLENIIDPAGRETLFTIINGNLMWLTTITS